MNSIVEEKVKGYLENRLNRRPTECGAILFNMREAARVAGYELGHAFGQAGLAAGPEARVASGIINRALGGGGGSAVSENIIGQTLDRWVRTTPRMGC